MPREPPPITWMARSARMHERARSAYLHPALGPRCRVPRHSYLPYSPTPQLLSHSPVAERPLSDRGRTPD